MGKAAIRTLTCVVSALLLASCGAKRLQYAPGELSGELQAAKIIEQVIMEQPPKLRPSEVAVTPDYVAYGDGVISTTKGAIFPIGGYVGVGVGKAKSKAQNVRLYFNSIGEFRLYRKNRWFVIDVIGNEGGLRLSRFYSISQHKAQQLIDALNSFVLKASEFGR